MYGRKVPENFRSVFAARRVLLRWINYVDAMETKLFRVSRTPGCEALDMEDIHRLLQQVKVRVNQAMPALMCDRCKAFDSQCPACGGKKWIITKDLTALRLKEL